MKPCWGILLLCLSSCSPISIREVPIKNPPTSQTVLAVQTAEQPFVSISTQKIIPSQTPIISNTSIPEPTNQVELPEGNLEFSYKQVQSSPGDASLNKGKVFIDKVEIVADPANPVSGIVVSITGSLPTPCHLLRVKTKSSITDHLISMDVYSLINPTSICIQSLAPFTLKYSLNNLPNGKYSLLLNKSETIEFELPL